MTTIWMTGEQYEKYLKTLSNDEVAREYHSSNILISDPIDCAHFDYSHLMEWVASEHPEILDDDMPDYGDDHFDDFYRWSIEAFGNPNA